MAEVEGPEYGVNLVQEHSRWSNFFQELRGKVTIEVCAFGACRESIYPISAADVIQWGVRVAALMAELAAVAKVPVGASGGGNPDGYEPEHSGPMVIDVEVADQSTVGDEVPEYVYHPPPTEG